MANAIGRPKLGEHDDWRLHRGAATGTVARARWAVLCVLGLLWSGPASGQARSDLQPAKATLAIAGGMLIDGQGPPRYNTVVLIDGKHIVAVGTADSLKVPAGAKVIDASGYTVMPGLFDVHQHLDLMGFGDLESGGGKEAGARGYVYWHRTYESRYDEIVAASAKQLLMSGVTTAVDVGGDCSVQVRNRDKINRGELVGPRLKVTCSYFHNSPPDVIAKHQRAKHVINVRTVEEARTAAITAIGRGADILKAHGRLTAEQIKVVAEEAHKKGLKLTGHVYGNDDLLARLANGQDVIEHTWGFDPGNPEMIRALLAHGTIVVPTEITDEIAVQALDWPELLNNPRTRELTPPDIWADIQRSLSDISRLSFFVNRPRGGPYRPDVIVEQGKLVKKLYDAGVRLLVGSDAGTPANFHTDGTWRQMELLVRYGIPPMEVIRAATRFPAEYLGMDDRVGTIEPGKLADIIVVDGNPLQNMTDLKHVVIVIKDGIQYKGPTTGAVSGLPRRQVIDRAPNFN